MLKIGDTVKVIGKTLDGSGEEKELIPIGTICRVVGSYNDDKNGLTVGIIPEGNTCYTGEYWYLACDVEKRSYGMGKGCIDGMVYFVPEVIKDIKRNYYCSGVCEKCEMGKHYGNPLKGYDTCDEEKLKGLRPIMINAPGRDPKLKNNKFKCEICGNPKLPDEKYCYQCNEYLNR